MNKNEMFCEGMLMADALPYRFTNEFVTDDPKFTGKEAEFDEARFLNWAHSLGRKITPADEVNFMLGVL